MPSEYQQDYKKTRAYAPKIYNDPNMFDALRDIYKTLESRYVHEGRTIDTSFYNDLSDDSMAKFIAIDNPSTLPTLSLRECISLEIEGTKFYLMAKQPKKPPPKKTRNVGKSKQTQLSTSSSIESPPSDNGDFPSIKLSPRSDSRGLKDDPNMSKKQRETRGMFKNLEIPLPPQDSSKSISSKSTHYTSSSSPSKSPTSTHVAPPPKLHFVILIKQKPQELPPLQISPYDPYAQTMDNWPSGPANQSPPPPKSKVISTAATTVTTAITTPRTKEVARKLEAEMKAEMDEEERIAREYNEANRAIIKEWDDVQAIIDADKQKCGRKPKENSSKKLKRCLEIVPEDDDDVGIEATPLSSKSSTIVDYKIYKEGKKSYFKIIKVDGNSQNYLTFGTMLKNFNREDLEVLRSIIIERFKKTKPVDYMDNLLFQTLKTMFEPHIKDIIWKYQQGAVKVNNWKLFDSCGV
nr:hypothetical protein [Tanacetum cinerariifolium]